MTPWQMLLSVLGCFVIIMAAYWVTRLVAGRSLKWQKGRIMQIIDHINLSRDKSVCLLKVGAQIYLIAISPQNAALIGKIEGEEAEALIAADKSFNPYGAWQRNIPGMTPFIKNCVDKIRQSADIPEGVVDIEDLKFDGGKKYTLKTDAGEDGLDMLFQKIQRRRGKGSRPPFKGG
jgi:flagellar biogenesis protein FliO